MWTLFYLLLISSSSYAQSVGEDTTRNNTHTHTRELEEVIVKGVGAKGSDRIGRFSISGYEINKRPALLGEHDAIKVLQSTSGVVAGMEGFSGLYVRGGMTDQNLYLLDGLPLLNVYHLGGLFSSFPTQSIDKVDFYKGSFPAAYAERSSSIVDIALKTPDFTDRHGTFSLGLMSGQLYFSTPIRKGASALSVGVRRTWFDVFSSPIIAIMNMTKKSDGQKTIFHYNFSDVLVKFSATDGRKNDLSLLLFYGKDNFKFGEERFDPENSRYVYQRDLNRMSWGNVGLSLNYKFFTPIGNLSIQPYISRAFSSDIQENLENNENSVSLNVVTKMRPTVFQTGMREIFDFHVTNGLEGVVGMQQTWYNYNVGNPTVNYSGIPSVSVSSRLQHYFRNSLLSGFVEFDCRIADAIQGSFGLRVNRYLSKEKNHWNMEPRVSLKVNLPHRSGIALGYSRMTQYSQQVSSNYIYLPSDAWLPMANFHKPLKSDIYFLGYSQVVNRCIAIRSELWWKNMHNMAEYKPDISFSTTTLPWYSKITFGKGWAYGLDLDIEGDYKSINWSASYGLMWNWREFSDINNGKRYPAKFDNRHKIDLSMGWKINDKMELTGQWEYLTGNRITLALYNVATPDIAFPDAPFVNPVDPEGHLKEGIDYFTGRDNVRMPAFHRLNLNLSRKGQINKKLSYQWDFGLYNAYCRMNPFSIVKSYLNLEWSNKGDYRKFRTLSLLPIIPSVSYTLNF